MEQEKNLLNFTQEELFRYIQMQRRIYALEEYQLMKTDICRNGFNGIGV